MFSIDAKKSFFLYANSQKPSQEEINGLRIKPTLPSLEGWSMEVETEEEDDKSHSKQTIVVRLNFLSFCN